MKKIYIVTCERHADCMIRDIVYHTIASNAKEACEQAKYEWRGNGHLFHVHAVKARSQDAHNIRLRTVTGKEIAGDDAIGHFFCVNCRA